MNKFADISASNNTDELMPHSIEAEQQLIGGLLNKTPATMEQIFGVNLIEPWGDAITRFSGITLCCIMTGVIWIGDPESFVDVLLYDNLHVLLWVGALFFALRGNNAK